MQLVAYGAQDIYLTGNPQITFFKVVYRRHTNFSMESILQTFSGTQDFNGEVVATISRNGDLVHRMYLEHSASWSGRAPDANASCVGLCERYGDSLIKEAEIEIGGQRIDKHTSMWNRVYSDLTEPNSTGARGQHVGSFLKSINFGGAATKFQRMSGFGGVETGTTSIKDTLFVPLPFWFCRNVGLSLPLIALQYHEVKITVEHLSIEDVGLYVDYIYLDTDERRRFAQVSHEYLIEQLQYQSMNEKNQRLNFNHPVKELVWFTPSGTLGSADAVEPANIPSLSNNGTWSLKLNGHDRFKPRNGLYFTRQQVYDYHTGYGSICIEPVALGASDTGIGFDSIFVYSFALKPEEHQPSGTCNFSRIDSAILGCENFDETSDIVTIYAVNYNVLRIMSGMGGLAYSN